MGGRTHQDILIELQEMFRTRWKVKSCCAQFLEIYGRSKASISKRTWETAGNKYLNA